MAFPVVVGLSQAGKEQLIEERSAEIRTLLGNGIAICLPDVRGTGETCPDFSRTPQSEATAISAFELMLGQTLFGARLRDLLGVLRYLSTRGDIVSQNMVIWGDSFAPTNPRDVADSLVDDEETPHQSEPLGGLLALFRGLCLDEVRIVVARGMIANYQSVLGDRFCYIPHDAIVPGAGGG